MKIWNDLMQWLYLHDMQKRGVIFEKEKEAPAWKPAKAADKGTCISVYGIVEKNIEEHLKKENLWVAPEKAELFLCDETALKEEGLHDMLGRIPDHAARVFWRHSDTFEVIPQDTLNHFTLCVDSRSDEMALDGLKLPMLLNLKVYNPIGRGSQNMKATVGVVLTEKAESGAQWDVLRSVLVRWAKRDDLAIWKMNGQHLNCLLQEPDLACAAAESVDAPSLVDEQCMVQVIVNLSHTALDPMEKLKRAARGQIWLDACLKDGRYVVKHPLEDKEIPVESFLLGGLEAHNHFLKLRTQLLRAVHKDCSLTAQLNMIGKAALGRPVYVPGVSVLVVSNKPEFFDKILANFRRQTLERKELVVVFHCAQRVSEQDMVRMYAMIRKDEVVRIYWRNSRYISFGYCINDGVALTQMEYVAKFDDDDYYAPHFLSDLMPAFEYTEAGVCGRISFHTYLEESRGLIVRKPGNEYTYCTFLPGATLVAHRCVFEKTMFRNIPRDIDGRFGVDCTSAGVRMFAADTFHLLVMRASDKSRHTWKANDSVILKQSLPAHREIDEDLECMTAYCKPFFPEIEVQKAIEQITA